MEVFIFYSYLLLYKTFIIATFSLTLLHIEKGSIFLNLRINIGTMRIFCIVPTVKNFTIPLTYEPGNGEYTTDIITEKDCHNLFYIIGKLYFVLEIRQNVYVNTNRLKQIMHLVLC